MERAASNIHLGILIVKSSTVYALLPELNKSTSHECTCQVEWTVVKISLAIHFRADRLGYFIWDNNSPIAAAF